MKTDDFVLQARKPSVTVSRLPRGAVVTAFLARVAVVHRVGARDWGVTLIREGGSPAQLMGTWNSKVAARSAATAFVEERQTTTASAASL